MCGVGCRRETSENNEKGKQTAREEARTQIAVEEGVPELRDEGPPTSEGLQLWAIADQVRTEAHNVSGTRATDQVSGTRATDQLVYLSC